MPFSAVWWEKDLDYVTFEQRPPPPPNAIMEVNPAFG